MVAVAWKAHEKLNVVPLIVKLALLISDGTQTPDVPVVGNKAVPFLNA